MIDGFRYGFIGHSDINLIFGIILLAVTNVIVLWLTIFVFKRVMV